jgi:hypothetical protein
VQDLKTRILDIATKKFVAHGFQGVHVEKIAFDYMSQHREVVLLTRNENLFQGKFIRRAGESSRLTSGLIAIPTGETK